MQELILQGKEWDLLKWLGTCGAHDEWQRHIGPLHWDNMTEVIGLWEKGLIQLFREEPGGKHSITLTDAGIDQVKRQMGWIARFGPRKYLRPEGLPTLIPVEFIPEAVQAFRRGEIQPRQRGMILRPHPEYERSTGGK